jgi:hypothetical protein
VVHYSELEIPKDILYALVSLPRKQEIQSAMFEASSHFKSQANCSVQTISKSRGTQSFKIEVQYLGECTFGMITLIVGTRSRHHGVIVRSGFPQNA